MGSGAQPVSLVTGLFQSAAWRGGWWEPASPWVRRDWEAGQRAPQVAAGQVVLGRRGLLHAGALLASNSAAGGGPFLSHSPLFRFEAITAASPDAGIAAPGSSRVSHPSSPIPRGPRSGENSLFIDISE